MKSIKSIGVMLICLCIMLSLFGMVSVSAATPNVTMTVSEVEVNVGDEITVELTNGEMTFQGLALFLSFDNELVECTAMLNVDGDDGDDDLFMYYINSKGKTKTMAPMVGDTIEDTNSDGKFQFAMMPGEDTEFLDGVIVTLTFVAKASGTVTFELKEECIGVSEYTGVSSANVTIKAAHTHSYDAVVTAPTCTEGGYTTYTCACNDSYVADETPAKGHTSGDVVVENKVDANCEGAGSYDNVVYCATCGDELSRQAMTEEAKGHTSGDVVVENKIDATCEGEGSYDNVVNCATCGKELSRQTVTVGAIGHAYDKSTLKDLGDGTHSVTTVCGNDPKHVKTEVVEHTYGNDHICDCDAEEPTGWVMIDDEWYYVYPDTYEKATGLARVPYPEQDLHTITYEANSEDVEYAANNAETKYTDADSAVFVFDDNGVFLFDCNGLVDGNRCAINGVVVWHAGLVEIDGAYYYFIGDEEGNGNVMVTDKLQYVTRDSSDLGAANGYYEFGEDGKLVENDGIVDVDGTLYYFEDSRLASEAGLIEIDGAYYYVRSRNGQIVVDNEYWISNTNGLLEAGIYLFDEEGKVIIPEAEVGADGIVEVDGEYFYYEDGVLMKGAGVIEMTDEMGETFYIYVTRNGKLATGEYWPTNRNGLLESGAYDWGTDGKYYPAN